jgi:hypothetical protein
LSLRRFRSIVARIARQVKSAQTPDRHDLALAQPPLRLANGRGQLRPAFRARIRLRMKAAIARIVIFRLARPAHVEARHGGVRAVVWNVADDRIARPAVGAIGEGVAKPPVGRIGEIAVAVRACRHVRRDQHELAFLRPAFANDEILPANRIHLRHQHLFDARQGRRFAAQALDEAIERIAGALGLRHDPGRRIQHVAREPQPPRQLEHERTEAHPLHHAANADLPPCHDHAR